jgi:hypothetical protein
MNHGGVVLLGELRDDRPAFGELGAARFPAFLHLPDRQAKRLAQHQPNAGELLYGVGQELVILLLVLLGGDAATQIVDANQNAEQVGLEVDGVFLPALLQVSDGVPADAAVQERELPLRESAAELRGEDELEVKAVLKIIR